MRCVLLAALLVAAAHAAPESRPALRPRSSKSVGTLVAATPPAESKLSLRGGSKSLTDVAMPSSVALMIGAGGIFLSFSVFAVLQEDVYKKAYGGEYFAFTFFALLLERGINALTAFLGVTLLGKSGLAIPHTDIFNSGVSQMLAMAASNEALRYVSYPTQVLGKSCKMVPVMAGGIVLGGKRYSIFEYAQVAMITIGVCVFNFGGKKKKSGADSPLGLALIGISLLMDAFTGSPHATEPSHHHSHLALTLAVLPSRARRRSPRQGEGENEAAQPARRRPEAPVDARVDALDEPLGFHRRLRPRPRLGPPCQRRQVLLQAPPGALRHPALQPQLGGRAELCLLHADAVQPAAAHDRHHDAQDLLHPLLGLPQPFQQAQWHAVVWVSLSPSRAIDTTRLRDCPLTLDVRFDARSTMMVFGGLLGDIAAKTALKPKSPPPPPPPTPEEPPEEPPTEDEEAPPASTPPAGAA